MEIKTIREAIASHSFWKSMLRTRLLSGSDFEVPEEVADIHKCPLGRWLDRLEPSQAVENAKLAHLMFHQEAARVLGMMEDGDADGAKKSINLRGRFFSASAELTTTLLELEKHLQIS